MLEFLTFRKFYAPIVIQILFWIGIGVCAVEGIGMIVSAATFRVGLGVINGLLVLLVGPIAVRVLCEVIMAIFGIHDALQGKRDR